MPPADSSHDATIPVNVTHRLRFTRGVWSPDHPLLADLLTVGSPVAGLNGRPVGVLVFIDSGVAAAQGDLESRVTRYFRGIPNVTLAGPVTVVPGGETCKNDPAVVEGVLGAIHDAGLCRQSYIVAIGGGAVLDAVGYAASIAHRGVRLIRVPTTTLAQADSGVGVKNGINAFGKKNYLGVFSVPWAVINDELTLETLSDRDWRCGFSEAVKVALIKDARLFERIATATESIAQRDLEVSMPIIRRSAQLHMHHIVDGGDPFELTTARPLDFGHWAAHKLEQMTGFELRHGEAVAIGLALDVTYARLKGMLAAEPAEMILATLSRLGFDVYHEAMRDTTGLMHGLEEFRQHLGGALTVTLLEEIGRPVDVHEIDQKTMTEAIADLADRQVLRTPAPAPEVSTAPPVAWRVGRVSTARSPAGS